MGKINKKSFFILFGIIGLIGSMQAQVTIGLGEAPSDGALLQLKDIENVLDGSANATKGFAFPRVNLERIDGLQPCLPTHIVGSSNGEHIGLTVYNLSEVAPFKKGFYFWNGNKWISMLESTSLWLESVTGGLANSSTDNMFHRGNVIIGNDESLPSVALDINATDKGFLLPRLSNAQRESIQQPVEGLLIYNTESKCIEQYQNILNGWYNFCSRIISGEGKAKLNFGSYKVSGTRLEVGKPITSSYTVTIPYTEGNGGAYPTTAITVNGLTASIADGFFAIGDGVIVFDITGTPSLAEISTCNLTLGGSTCSFQLNVRNHIPITINCATLHGANIPSYPMCSTVLIDNEIVWFSKSIVGTLPALGANPESAHCGISMPNDGSVMRLGKDLKSITLLFSQPVNRVKIVSNWHAFWSADGRFDSHRVTTNSTGTISPENIVTSCISNFKITGKNTQTINVITTAGLYNGLSYVVEATSPYTELTLSVGDTNYDEILVAFSLCEAFATE